jgi:EAL domain-containing protein (putative c-di-GMP-specific phosphodiesterase class I)/ActR/RegA family two-component response regulator
MVKILLVEDNKIVARSQQRLLDQAGYQTDMVTCGAAAMTRMESNGYDLILCDIGLPDMDGLDVLRNVRRHDPDIPVVFITGTPSLETAIKAVDQHAFRYLVKPVAPEALLKTVEDASQIARFARLQRQALECAWREDETDPIDLNNAFDFAIETLWIAFQPIVSWSEQRVVAYEALVRNDESNLARPPDLLAAAERLGRLNELGRHIRQSVADAADALPRDIQIFVNLLPTDLNDDDLLSLSAPLSSIAERVVLEITEREPLGVVSDLQTRLKRLRMLGYRIAIDDLGEGHAGLNAFVQLQPDIVKLDRCLIREIDQNRTRRGVVGSMIDLCSKMDIQLIAEGVETSAEREVLVKLGGDWLQGYLFARPAKGFPRPNFT